MEFLQLKYFCSAAKTENFAETAREFGVPRASISQAIKRLEKELSSELFDRVAGGVKLNECGEVFYKSAKTALNSIMGAQRIINDSEDEINGEINLIVLSGERLVIESIKEFNKLYKNVAFHVDYKMTYYDSDLSEYDFIITDNWRSPFGTDGVTKHTTLLLFDEELMLAVHKDSPLAQKDSLTLYDLKYDNVVAMHIDNALCDLLNRECFSFGAKKNDLIRCNDPQMLIDCVNMGLGIALVPKKEWGDKFSDDVIVKEFRGWHKKTILGYSADYHMTKVAKEFKRIISKLAENYAKKEEE